MNSRDARARREKKTLAVMVGMYCRAHHGRGPKACTECQELMEYASKRIDRCPFLEAKPTCARCRVHCFETRRRDGVRTVMRYSGPRMLFRHPIMAIRHMIDGARKAPEGKRAGASERQ